jgi:hypothetical protein
MAYQPPYPPGAPYPPNPPYPPAGNGGGGSPYPPYPPGFLTPMSPRDRNEIVIQWSGFNGYSSVEKDAATGAIKRVPYVPLPIKASRAFLSAGWMAQLERSLGPAGQL